MSTKIELGIAIPFGARSLRCGLNATYTIVALQNADRISSINGIKREAKGFWSCRARHWRRRAALWATWLLYAVLIDLSDEIADELTLPFDSIFSRNGFSWCLQPLLAYSIFFLPLLQHYQPD